MSLWAVACPDRSEEDPSKLRGRSKTVHLLGFDGFTEAETPQKTASQGLVVLSSENDYGRDANFQSEGNRRLLKGVHISSDVPHRVRVRVRVGFGLSRLYKNAKNLI